MKKLLSLGFALTVTLAASGVQKYSEFIAGSDVQLTNNSTLVYTQRNVFFKGIDGAERWAFGTSNQPVTVVNGVSYYTNAVQVNANIVNPQAWNDVKITDNVNGDVGQFSLSVVCAGQYETNGNRYTFTFIHVPNGNNVDTVNANSVQRITGTFDVLGAATNTVWTTNLPSTFLYGGGKIRLVSVSSTNSVSDNFEFVRSITLNGFVP